MRWRVSIILAAFLVPGAFAASVPCAAANTLARSAAAFPQSAAGLPESTKESPDIRGSWKPETYRLKFGPVHEVTGLITFTEKDWSVLFFIVTDEGPRRGSGEGGTYSLDGDKLTFRHLYNLSGGHAVDGFEASDLSMRVRPPDAVDAPAEPCAIEVKDDLLTIFFPSGNQMTFRRSSD
ncbi:MAG: hypothetical protein OXG98_10390 [Gemmatimonadetes bacterium]|nr:hypothetical protein [Gemmatimonadota bacterium]